VLKKRSALLVSGRKNLCPKSNKPKRQTSSPTNKRRGTGAQKEKKKSKKSNWQNYKENVHGLIFKVMVFLAQNKNEK